MSISESLDIRRKRTLIASFFLTVLTGIAIDRCISNIWEILRKGGLYTIYIVVAYIFLVTIIRFFIGNQLHLFSIEKHECLFPMMWLTDFLFIFIESIIFIFLGISLSLFVIQPSEIQNLKGFFFFIVILLTIDIVWVLMQFVMERCDKRCKRKIIPWGWAVLNISTIIYLVVFKYFNMLYSTTILVCSAVVFTVAAFVDLFLLDHHGLLKQIK